MPRQEAATHRPVVETHQEAAMQTPQIVPQTVRSVLLILRIVLQMGRVDQMVCAGQISAHQMAYAPTLRQ